MSIRTMTLDILKAWLPSDYLTATTWTDAALQTALDGGHHPRLIAAEVWEEKALAIPEDPEGEKVISSWGNGDVSVEYAVNRSPRQYAQRQAQYHRARGPVKTVRLANRNVQFQED